jgi:hypothetical protein
MWYVPLTFEVMGDDTFWNTADYVQLIMMHAHTWVDMCALACTNKTAHRVKNTKQAVIDRSRRFYYDDRWVPDITGTPLNGWNHMYYNMSVKPYSNRGVHKHCGDGCKHIPQSQLHLEVLQWARANGCPWDKDLSMDCLGLRAPVRNVKEDTAFLKWSDVGLGPGDVIALGVIAAAAAATLGALWFISDAPELK